MTHLARIARADVPEELIENSILAAFGNAKNAKFYKFDFMWVAHDGDMNPKCFTLCREESNEKVWLAYGGAMPTARGADTFKSFRRMLDELAKDYRFIGAQVENVNFAMLKFYIASEFKIVGTRLNPEGKLFVEFFKEVVNG